MSDTRNDPKNVRARAVAHGDALREAAVARARELHEAAVAHASSVMDALHGAPPQTAPPITAPRVPAEEPSTEAHPSRSTEVDGTPPRVHTETASS